MLEFNLIPSIIKTNSTNLREILASKCFIDDQTFEHQCISEHAIPNANARDKIHAFSKLLSQKRTYVYIYFSIYSRQEFRNHPDPEIQKLSETFYSSLFFLLYDRTCYPLSYSGTNFRELWKFGSEKVSIRLFRIVMADES